MATTHELIFGAGLLGLLAIFAAAFSTRFGSPLLLAFIGLGMLAGEDGPGGIYFDDYERGYLIGSLALVVILFEGGLGLKRPMLKPVLMPAIGLATIGVLITAGVVAAGIVLLLHFPWPVALLIGATVAPTDAAAVAVMLRSSAIPVAPRVIHLLELESGLNDPMSVFLTIGLVQYIIHPAGVTVLRGALFLLQELGGGALIGMGGGFVLLWLLRRTWVNPPLYPVLALSGALSLFGAAQTLGASGFLAVYLAGAVIGVNESRAANGVTHFFEPLGWLAQIALFLMLGLLVTPHDLPSTIGPGLAIAAILIFLARPAAVAGCLLPLGWKARESVFIAWVGLRGAVPIYLSIIPILANLRNGERIFSGVFVIVIASVALQGWTLGPLARWLTMKEEGLNQGAGSRHDA
jgi:cell volume regulation protein A